MLLCTVFMWRCAYCGIRQKKNGRGTGVCCRPTTRPVHQPTTVNKRTYILYPTQKGRPMIASPRSAVLQAHQTEQPLRSPAFKLTL